LPRFADHVIFRAVPNPRLLLLVDDNDDDAFFLEKTLRRTDPEAAVQRVRNGQEAIDYLLGERPFSDREQHPVPTVIMLDLKMPVCDGFAFLTWKREQRSLSCIPTIVMTSSALDRDVRRSYELGAHSYTTKVHGIDRLRERLTALRDWWFNNCILTPSEDRTLFNPDRAG
jgi:CheY-like chemotaxis protein